MNVYIFQDVEQISDREHASGGLVVVARDRDDINYLIVGANFRGLDNSSDSTHIDLTEEDWDNVVFYKCDTCKPRLFIFPNAGCC